MGLESAGALPCSTWHLTLRLTPGKKSGCTLPFLVKGTLGKGTQKAVSKQKKAVSWLVDELFGFVCLVDWVWLSSARWGWLVGMLLPQILKSNVSL